MTITYLYLKTHNKTGLKYLGKTTRDPYLYAGSGTYWQRHINKHGYDVTTEILAECSSNEEVKEKGLYYSKLWDIVESKDFANLKEETGNGGFSKQAIQLLVMSRKKIIESDDWQNNKAPLWKNKLSVSVAKTKNDPLWKETTGLEVIRKYRKTTSTSEWINSVGRQGWDKAREKQIKTKNNPQWKTNNLRKCSHCDRSVDAGNYKRWHGNNCKMKGVK